MEIKETGREMQRERKRETYKERVTITRFPRPRAIIYRLERSPRRERNVHEGGKDNIERGKGCCKKNVGGNERKRRENSSK